MRALALLVLLVLACFGRDAQAQTYPYSEAVAYCNAKRAEMVTADNHYGYVRDYSCEVKRGGSGKICLYYGEVRPATGTPYEFDCWNFSGDAPPTCEAGYGEDPFAPGQCLTAAKCTARNSSLANSATVRNFTSACVGGCSLKADESADGMVGVGGMFTGTYKYTGAGCETPANPVQTPDQAKEPPAEKCEQNGSFQFCLKPNGDHCLSTANGRQNCWRPGEVGEKTDGPVLQKRVAGNQEIPPNLEIGNGDTLVKQGQSLTQTTTITKNTTTSTITTTTTNYKTVNGTNAGPKDSGQNAGTGNPSSGPDGDGEEGEENGVNGDGSCTGGWSPTGDPVLGGILTESWKERCNGEKLQADMRTDAQTVADATLAEGDPDSVWSGGDDAGAINQGWLVFGAGSCPVIAIPLPNGQVFSPPPAFCSVIAALAALFQLAAYLWALRIVSSD